MQRDICTFIYNWMITSCGNSLLSDDVIISWDSAESEARKETGEYQCSWLTESQVPLETAVLIIFIQGYRLCRADRVLQQEPAHSQNI